MDPVIPTEMLVSHFLSLYLSETRIPSLSSPRPPPCVRMRDSRYPGGPAARVSLRAHCKEHTAHCAQCTLQSLTVHCKEHPALCALQSLSVVHTHCKVHSAHTAMSHCTL